ncbi:hypothetical protein Syun_010826 [Stephania yunnanensis]|uniref:DAGKc domain-containing protein n=1 Tax=Stephania yunnanensis TaxID=152371 RepID=A0AAP0KH87_9MAGN
MEVREGEAIPRERVRVNGTLTTAKLSGDGELQWEEEEEAEGRPRRRRSLSVEREVLGVAAEGSRIVVRAFVEKENRWCCGGNRRVREREDFVFEPLSADSQRLWCVKIQECIDSLETQRQLHAKEIASALDLSKYDGIVCVSGDGVLVEVVNGLLQREDWDSAIKLLLGLSLQVVVGLVADIDIESEKYRWMGSSRLDFYVCG